MLATEQAQHGIRECTLQEFSGPMLPFIEKRLKMFRLSIPAVASEKLYGAWRRPGARVQQRDLPLTLGKSRVEHWQIANDYRQERKASCPFSNGYYLIQRDNRRDIA